MSDTVEVKKDSRGEWRWRYKAPNGKVLADSGEGYQNKQDCVDALRVVTGVDDFPYTATRFTLVTVKT